MVVVIFFSTWKPEYSCKLLIVWLYWVINEHKECYKTHMLSIFGISVAILYFWFGELQPLFCHQYLLFIWWNPLYNDEQMKKRRSTDGVYLKCWLFEIKVRDSENMSWWRWDVFAVTIWQWWLLLFFCSLSYLKF